MQKSFTFHDSWKNVISGLPTQVRLEVYDAIMEYGLSGTLKELKATAGLAFAILKNDIDADNHRAETIRRKRSEAGKRHKGNQYSILLEQNGTNGTSVPSNRNKCSKEPLYKGVSEGCKNGTSVPMVELKEEKETLPPTPPFQEKKENNTYISARTHIEISFEEFWNAYGYKKSKMQAERAWNRLSSADKTNAFSSIPDYKRDCQACGRSMKYPATYLNGRTWEDDFSSNNNSYATTQTNQGFNKGSEHPTDSELREQSVRLMQRLADERHARQAEVRQRTEFPTESQP